MFPVPGLPAKRWFHPASQPTTVPLIQRTYGLDAANRCFRSRPIDASSHNFVSRFCKRLEILWGTANRRRVAKQRTRRAQGAEIAPKQCPISQAETIKTSKS